MLTCSIFMSLNNFLIIFFTYIKNFEDSSVKYYQNDKERLQKLFIMKKNKKAAKRLRTI